MSLPAWLATVPTTQLRIVTSVALAALFVLGVLILIACHVALPADILTEVGVFILAMMGIDLAQFGIKRATFRQSASPTTGAGNGQ